MTTGLQTSTNVGKVLLCLIGVGADVNITGQSDKQFSSPMPMRVVCLSVCLSVCLCDSLCMCVSAFYQDTHEKAFS